MTIRIVRALGRGKTNIAAFDNALYIAGVHNRNLIALSSVVPEGSVVEEVESIKDCPGKWGDRLYVVMASNITDKPNQNVSSGIGFSWSKDLGMAGLFVEHETSSNHKTSELINLSLNALSEHRGEYKETGRREYLIEGTCKDNEYVCALVLAVYESEGWLL